MVATASVRAGDVLRVLPGERVPVKYQPGPPCSLLCQQSYNKLQPLVASTDRKTSFDTFEQGFCWSFI